MSSGLDLTAVMGHVEHFQRRVIQDALSEATGDYWRRRGAALAAARPRPGDFNGHVSREVADVDWDTGWPTFGPRSRWFAHGQPVPADRMPTRWTEPPLTIDRLSARDQALLDTSRACYAASAVALAERWSPDA